MTYGEPAEEERPVRKLPSPVQLERFALRLRKLTEQQRAARVDQVLSPDTIEILVAALLELARVRSTPSERERRLQERCDALAILATSRRLPLAAVEGALRRAESGRADSIPVEEIRRALTAAEPRT